MPVGLLCRENAIVKDKIKYLKKQTFFSLNFKKITIWYIGFFFVKMSEEEKTPKSI